MGTVSEEDLAVKKQPKKLTVQRVQVQSVKPTGKLNTAPYLPAETTEPLKPEDEDKESNRTSEMTQESSHRKCNKNLGQNRRLAGG